MWTCGVRRGLRILIPALVSFKIQWGGWGYFLQSNMICDVRFMRVKALASDTGEPGFISASPVAGDSGPIETGSPPGLDRLAGPGFGSRFPRGSFPR